MFWLGWGSLLSQCHFGSKCGLVHSCFCKDMTEGKSIGAEAPSASFRDCSVLNLVGKCPTVDLTEGKSVGAKAPSAPYRDFTVKVLVRKCQFIYVTEGKNCRG